MDASKPTPSIDAMVLLDARAPTADAASTDAAQSQTDGGDPSAALYDPSKLLEVKLTLSDADWNTLRNQGRNIDDNFSGCADADFDYTKLHASVQIGDQTFPDVAVRKKGFLGSISTRKPSLRIELDEYMAGQSLLGTKTLILNNDRTDGSYVHQCMAYAQFRAAGIAAPRCSFAHVSVNGQSLGIFTNVEPIKKAFIRRTLGTDTGNLYEGSSPADFRTEMLGNFAKKTNEADPAKPELEALAALLLKSDDELAAGLDALVDTDEFLRFWATESLIADWDGYSSDINNFFLYADPTTKKLTFIPWGPDDAYNRNPALLARPAGTPQSVYTTARLARRLYQIPATRERYRQTLRDLLAQHWDEAALLAEVDRMASLIGGVANPISLEQQRTFIRTRRAELLAELDAPAVDVAGLEREARSCHPEQVQSISGSFDTTWGSLGAATPALGNTLSLVGMAVPALTVLAGSGDAVPPYVAENGLTSLPNSLIQLTAVRPDTSLVVVQLSVGESPLVSGTIGLHGFETFGVVLAGADASSLKLVGLMGEGSITFTQASATAGAPVAGNFSGKMVFLAPLPPVKTLP